MDIYRHNNLYSLADQNSFDDKKRKKFVNLKHYNSTFSGIKAYNMKEM